METTQLEPDVILFRGDSYESIATAFVDGDRVLLVDALADLADARQMRRHIEESLGKRVAAIVLTHCDTDHMAGVRLFPQARVVAHRLFMYTFAEKHGRDPVESRRFVVPTDVVDQACSLDFGRHALELFHNPGKTMCSLGIDAPSAAAMFVADNIVGNIMYVGASAFEVIDAAIARLMRRRARERVIPGHSAVHGWQALANARHYLAALCSRVRALREQFGGPEADAAIMSLRIEECIAAGVEATAFERTWHRQNLLRIVERNLLATDRRAPREAGAQLLIA